VFVDLADPFTSESLQQMMYTGRAKLSESEELTYNIWRLWKFHNTRPWEVYPDINREQAAKAFLKLEEYHQDRQRMNREKKRQIQRPTTVTGRYSYSDGYSDALSRANDIIRRFEEEDHRRRINEDLL
jgi:hypothetical protein